MEKFDDVLINKIATIGEECGRLVKENVIIARQMNNKDVTDYLLNVIEKMVQVKSELSSYNLNLKRLMSERCQCLTLENNNLKRHLDIIKSMNQFDEDESEDEDHTEFDYSSDDYGENQSEDETDSNIDNTNHDDLPNI